MAINLKIGRTKYTCSIPKEFETLGPSLYGRSDAMATWSEIVETKIPRFPASSLILLQVLDSETSGTSRRNLRHASAQDGRMNHSYTPLKHGTGTHIMDANQ